MKNLNKHLIFLLLAAFLFGTVLTACGGEDPTPTPRPANDDDDDGDPPPEEDPTEEPEEEPTDEPDPTPEPTEEPTPEPTDEPDPTAGFAQFSNATLGLDFSYPDDWAIEFDELGSSVDLASSQEVLDSADDNITGAIMNIVLFNRADLEFLATDGLDMSNPADVLSIFTEQIALAGGDEAFELAITQEPVATTINGQEAAVALARATSTTDNEEANVRLSVILGEARAAFIFSGTELSSESEYQPILDAIENSIVISTPEGTPPIGTGDGTGELPVSQGFLLYGDTINSSVDATGPSVWDFVGLEGESVDIIVEPEGDFDVVVDVLNESGASILPNGEIDASFGTEEVRNLVIPAAGLYYISVRGFADATGNYSLMLVESGEASTTPPVTGGEGTPIAYGDFVSGVIDAANPVAAYSFAGSADDIAGAVITPLGGFDVVVDVIDASGNSLLSRERDASFTIENVLFALPADGVYTIQVYGFDGATGSFDMQLGVPFTNVVFANPDTLEADDEGAGHSFPFRPLRAGDMVGIYAEPEDGLDIAVQVRKGDELLGAEVGIDSSLEGDDSERGFDVAVGAEEFAMIASEATWYSFRVLNSQDEDFGGNIGNYEVTLFGNPEIVFELAYGDFVDARTNPDGLIDYVMSGSIGDSLVINVQSDDDSVDLIIEVLDLDENVLASVDDGFSGEPEDLVYTFESEDLVIIRVRDFTGGEGDFIMSVDSQ
ncbi:hypothetical protein [Candidatus Leptofilum sp.]|uniref:hypothetical protein n=1 Tax=Candidatus Leptofilum sp. TaxID=3241576 RepID=UPI003B592712